MATRPGEDLAATLFGDVHYYYGSPTAIPPHHRFEKGSYVYLFENAGQRRARIEIANNAGKPHQDAFNGHLDNTDVQYSYRHTNLVTVTVDGPNARRDSVAPADSQEWHLPHFDPRNENKYMYRLHTVDIYFWTKEDAVLFVNSIRRVLPPSQITVEDEPVAPPPHSDAMSPVVQKLESVAISDPSYQHGQTRDSRTSSTSFAPPPLSAVPSSQQASNFNPPSSQAQEPPAFAPMAYNPAAPAAPETIKHREKTPPPEDGAANPLMAAAASDHGQTYGGHHGGFSGPPAPQIQSQGSYFPGPPGPPAGTPPSQTQSQSVQSPYAQHFQHSFAAPPTAPTSAVPGPPPYKTQSTPHVPVTQYANFPGSPGVSSGMTSPVYSPGITSPQQPAPFNPSAAQTTAAAPPPPGGYAQYSYGSTSDTPVSHTPAFSTDYSVHQQVYRPTESEASIKHNEKPKPAQPNEKPPTGKLEQGAARLEKGVSGFLKKLEKKF